MQIEGSRKEPQRFEDMRVLYSKASLKPVEHQSVHELGSLFLNYFREATTVYEMIFRDAESLSRPFITSHRELWSFKHLNVQATEARGLSKPVDILHREFRNLAFRLTQVVAAELRHRLGPGERPIDTIVELDSLNRKVITENRPPGAGAVVRLEESGIFHGVLTTQDGTQLPLVLSNMAGIGDAGQPLLHTALALRDQSIHGIEQPFPVFSWLRDVVGLQQSVFTTMIRYRRAITEALADQYPHLSPFDVGLDVPFSARSEIARSIREQSRGMQWAEDITAIYCPREKDPRRFTLAESILHLGEVSAPYCVDTPAELATILHAFGVSLIFSKVWDKEEEPPESIAQLCSDLKIIAGKLGQSSEIGAARELAEAALPVVRDLHDYLRQVARPLGPAERVTELLNDWLSKSALNF